MPVGMTFAGKAYDDVRLLRFAAEFDRRAKLRARPPRTPELPDDVFMAQGAFGKTTDALFQITVGAEMHALNAVFDEVMVQVKLHAAGPIDSQGAMMQIHVNGEPQKSLHPVVCTRRAAPWLQRSIEEYTACGENLMDRSSPP